MQAEIRRRAESAADRLQKEGLNAVDQLVGSFGPALEVYSRYAEVRTDTGDEVGVDRAIDIASDAVSNWRIQQLAARGLQGVEAEGRFALLCWDVLGAAEFRFNEAKLLGHAVGMDVSQLAAAGLGHARSDKIKILSAKDRRRSKADRGCRGRRQGWQGASERCRIPHGARRLPCARASIRRSRRRRAQASALHARSLGSRDWDKDSPVARLLAALVQAAPVRGADRAGQDQRRSEVP